MGVAGIKWPHMSHWGMKVAGYSLISWDHRTSAGSSTWREDHQGRLCRRQQWKTRSHQCEELSSDYKQRLSCEYISLWKKNVQAKPILLGMGKNREEMGLWWDVYKRKKNMLISSNASGFLRWCERHPSHNLSKLWFVNQNAKHLDSQTMDFYYLWTCREVFLVSSGRWVLTVVWQNRDYVATFVSVVVLQNSFHNFL